MAGVCSRCNVSERCKYWQEFPANKHKFFKVLIGDFEHYLRIPKKFIECFNGRISRKCILRGPSGNEWKVKIERKRDYFVFSYGWETFIRDNRLEITDFLTFTYVENSLFDVCIFDRTGCEKEGSYFAKNMSSSTHATCTSSLHFETVVASDELQDSETSLREPSCAAAAAAAAAEEEEEEEEENEEEEECGVCPKLKRMRGSSSKEKQPQKHYISNRRMVSSEEKRRAHDIAMSFMKIKKPTKVPMFALTMRRTYVYNGFNLTVPKEWALKHMLKETHAVDLKIPEDDTEIWTVGCRWTSSQCQIRAKWPEFVLDNNLEEHDVCVFELVQKGKSHGQQKPVFVVHIFRVVAEIFPLTVSRSVL